MNEVDLIITPHTSLQDLEKKINTEVMLFPYGFDSNVFYPRNFDKIYDFGFSGALHAYNNYPEGSFKNPNIRQKAYKILKSLDNFILFWKSTDDFDTARIHDNIEYAETVNKSKIWMATQAAFGDITPRYFEVMGSGSLLFCEKNPPEYKNIFKSNFNCVEFKSSLNNFANQLCEILNNDNLLFKIISQASKEAHQKHTWDVRADELVDIIAKRKSR